MNKSFWSGLLDAAINGAAKAAGAAGDGGAPIKTVGIAAGAGSLAGVLGYILTHPLGAPAAPAVAAVTAPKV